MIRVARNNTELFCLISLGYIISFVGWIIQRATTANVASFEFASRFMHWQDVTYPMAIYGGGLVVAKTYLLFALARHNQRAASFILAGLTAFWFFIAISSAIAVFKYSFEGPGTLWYNFTHARNTLGGFALFAGFGLWHYFASTRDVA